MKTLTLRLTIDVEYDLNGDDPDNVKQQLGYCAQHLASEGLLSGALNAEVETWDYTVEQA